MQGIVAVRPGRDNALQVNVRFPKLSALPTVIARVRRVFDLAADPQAISAQLAEDQALAPLVAIRPGLRVPGAWDGFELAVRAMLGQQITVSAAIRLDEKGRGPSPGELLARAERWRPWRAYAAQHLWAHAAPMMSPDRRSAAAP